MKALGLQGQEKRILKFAFFIPMFKIVTPGAGSVLTPGASYGQNLEVDHKETLHTKYQSPMPFSLTEKEF